MKKIVGKEFIAMKRKMYLLGIVVMTAVYVMGCGNRNNTVDADQGMTREASLEKESVKEAPTKQAEQEGTETTEEDITNMQ